MPSGTSFSLVKVMPVKADIFDMLRGLSSCEDACLDKYHNARRSLFSNPYKHSYRDDNAKYKSIDDCGSKITVSVMRCSQQLVINAEQKELDIEAKAGLMAAQGKIYGIVNAEDAKQIELLNGRIGEEIDRVVDEAKSKALKLNPKANVSRIYSPAGNNALVVDKYLDLQKQSSNYREAYCKTTTLFSELAACSVLKSALADKLED